MINDENILREILNKYDRGIRPTRLIVGFDAALEHGSRCMNLEVVVRPHVKNWSVE